LSDGAPPGSLQVYVWFEADPADAAEVRDGFARLRDAMAVPGARLLRRPDRRQRPEGLRETWMEVWPGIAAPALPRWLRRLEAAADAAGQDRLARGGRHVEPFEPIA
jgi:hypothetical protein